MEAARQPLRRQREERADRVFWQFRNVSDDEGELILYGEISEYTWWGDEVTPKQFLADLKALGNKKTITVRINSPGGDVFAAHAIYTNLRDHPANIVAKIDGIAASAAVIVALAANRIMIPSSSYMMVHKPAAGLLGYFIDDDLEQIVRELAVIKEGIVNGYAERTKKDKKAISKMMDAVTWMTGEEAVAEGFADELMFQDAGAQNTMVDGDRLVINGVGFDMAMLPQRVVASFASMSAGRRPGSPSAQTGQRAGSDNVQKSDQKEGSHDMRPEDIKTVDELKKLFPALADQLEKAANAAGAETERKRIQAIDELDGKVDPALLKDAKYKDTASIAETVAMKALKEGKFLNAAYTAAVADDAKTSGAQKVPGAAADTANGKGTEDKAALAHVAEVAKHALGSYAPKK